MAISNTSILIKRSSSTGTPASLKAGEIAYSYLSNTLFLGTVGGNGVVNVGGQYYTSTIDSATQSNTASTLVKRDPNGAFFGQLYGNANSSSYLAAAQNFSISGGDITAGTVAFQGNNAVVLNASLNAVPGLSAGSVGSATSVPVIQYGSNGRILSVSSAAIQTAWSISDGTTSNTVNGGSTLTLKANTGSGITTNVNNNETVYFGVDNTIVRSNTASPGIQTIGTDLQISGNLIVRGTQSYINSATFDTSSSLIELAANNFVGDVIDIGFYGVYNNGTTNNITGLVRDAGSKNYYLFSNVAYASAVSGNVISNNFFTAANTSTLYANLNAPSLSATNATFSTANTTNDLGVGGNLYVTNTVKASSLTLTNALTVPNGGTGQSSFTNGSIIVGSGTGALGTLANSTYSNTGTYGTNSTLASLTVDAYGRVTAASWQSIAGLTVSQGGTGQSSFTTNGITYGNGTGAIQATVAAGTSDQTWSNQILTVNNTGVPVWSTTMDGGSF